MAKESVSMIDGHIDNLQKKDNVNHPGHYEPGNFECIDVTAETQGSEVLLDFCLRTAFKNLFTVTNGKSFEDVKKQNTIVHAELNERSEAGDDKRRKN